MSASSLRRTLGRIRAPILAIVAGVGFLVHGGSPGPRPADAASPPGTDVLHATRDALAASARPATGLGLTSLLGVGVDDGRSRGRGDPARPRPSALLDVGSAPGLRERVLAAATRRGGIAREALARAGRLSAPATAPPLRPS